MVGVLAVAISVAKRGTAAPWAVVVGAAAVSADRRPHSVDLPDALVAVAVAAAGPAVAARRWGHGKPWTVENPARAPPSAVAGLGAVGVVARPAAAAAAAAAARRRLLPALLALPPPPVAATVLTNSPNLPRSQLSPHPGHLRTVSLDSAASLPLPHWCCREQGSLLRQAQRVEEGQEARAFSPFWRRY
ncbi:unnamed protein product [Ectocarpus sp. 12 AP-2014]